MEELSPSEMSFLTRATQRNIQEDAILQRRMGLYTDKMGFRKSEWSCLGWIDLDDEGSWRAVVNTVMKLRVPQSFGSRFQLRNQ
jgi:hypothetical protein